MHTEAWQFASFDWLDDNFMITAVFIFALSVETSVSEST